MAFHAFDSTFLTTLLVGWFIPFKRQAIQRSLWCFEEGSA